MNGDRSEVLREGADDLTLRAEEFGTLKACINVDHIDKKCRGPPLLDADWYAFCQAIYKGIEGSEGKSCTIITENSVRQLEPKTQVRARRQGAVGYEGSQRQGR